jgi:hypothetical protein
VFNETHIESLMATSTSRLTERVIESPTEFLIDHLNELPATLVIKENDSIICFFVDLPISIS